MRRALLLLTSAAALAACNAGLVGDDLGPHTELVDLLIIPPDGSNLPAQVVPNLSFDVLDPDPEIQLSTGSTFAALVSTTDGVPLANASVRISMLGAGIDSTRVTDTAGRIAIPLGPGEYDIEVTPDRLLNFDVPPKIFRNMQVTSEPTPLPVPLTMAKGIGIRGSVLDAMGSPELGWRVSARNEHGDPSTWADTTPIGFQIFVSTTGSWTVQIAPPNGSGAPIARKTLVVPPEGMVQDFQYEFFPARTISGQVTGISPVEPPPSAAGITVRARATLPSADPGTTYTFDQRTTTDSMGLFELPVFAGIYSLSIEPPLDSEWSHRVIQSVDASTQDMSVDPALTQLFPTVDLTGRVLAAESGQGTSGARVALVAADGTSYAFTDRSESGGAYEMTIDLGPYSVLVLPDGESGLVRHVEALEVTAETENVDFELESGFKVKGTVLAPVTGEPLANVTVMVLRSSDKQPVGSAEWLTDENGRWVLTLPLAQ